jgi:signal peptidase I
MTFENGFEPSLLDAAVALMGTAGRLGTVRVLGESMRPTLPPGSLLCVEFEPKDIGMGDLLLFRQADYLAVHRLLGRASRDDGRTVLRTRGDNVPAFDPAVDPSRVVGRVIALERDGSWRDLKSGGARAYASLLAIHDFFWTAAAVLADRSVDRVLRKLRLPVSLRRAVSRLDATLLRAADRLFFRLAHSPVPPPDFEVKPE